MIQNKDPSQGKRNPLKKPVIKIDNYVRKHTSSVDVEALHSKGFKKVNYITLSKINELIAHAVDVTFTKYQDRLSEISRRNFEKDVEAELAKRLREPRDEEEVPRGVQEAGVIPPGVSPDLAADAAAVESRLLSSSGETEEVAGVHPANLEELEMRLRFLVTRTVDEVIERRGLPEDGGDALGVEKFKQRLTDVLGEVLERERERKHEWQDADSPRRTELLERRLEKLKKQLLEMEVSMETIGAEKGMDPGLASIYHEVQGLNQLDEQYEKKKGLLSTIFEANVRLQSKKPGTGIE